MSELPDPDAEDTPASHPAHTPATGTGLRAAAAIAGPVALGLVPLGVAFGVLLTQVGFAWYWAPIFSLVIYAGSMEFLAISLVTAGVSPFSAALYALLVNFRHVFYPLNYPLHAVRSPLGRAYGIYALTDETYAILAANPKQKFTGPQIIGVQAILQSSWVGGGLLGGLFGDALPVHVEGMEFALVALFVVLLLEAFKANRDASLVFTALLAAGIGAVVSPDNMLMIAMVLYFLALMARFYMPGLDRALRWQLGQPAHQQQATATAGESGAGETSTGEGK